MMESVLNFLIPIAHAETANNVSHAATQAATAASAASAQPNGGYSLTVMLVVFVVFAYLLILRPQNKRAKETQNLLNSLNKGDEVMTAGGLIGRIMKLTDQYALITVADNVEILIQKTSIVSLLPKGTIKSLQ